MSQVQAIGILGGTFDPIHFAHLRLAEEVAQAFGLDHVRLIPAAVPPHRSQPGASAAHRLAMVDLAVRENVRLVVDRRELDRSGPSYTYDTLAEIRHESGQQPVCMLMGADAFVALTTWHRWRDLFDLAHIVVARRPGFPLEQLTSSLPDSLQSQYLRRYTQDSAVLKTTPAGCIFTHQLTALDVSATALRDLIKRKGSLRYLLPEAVIAYIEQHHLYQDQHAS